jgi:cytochrome c biogenesis protein CcmG, thiol:disulfide interchange protein DsbE
MRESGLPTYMPVKRCIPAAIACAAVIAGCGSGSPKSAAPSAAVTGRALAGSPAPLASLHDQSSQILSGGASAFKERLASLKGHPVVVNKWASWCGPCRAEFPMFQRLSVQLGKNVGFIGVNTSDNVGDAKSFLKRYPVSYPSYEDGDGKIAEVFNGIATFPATAFYDASGRLQYMHQGQYPSEQKLRADIKRYING